MFRSVCGVCLVLLLASPAWAKKIVYSPIVHEGEKEIEYYIEWYESSGGDDVVGHEIELKYGFGPRDSLGLYVVLEDTNGVSLDVKRYKSEWIHQLYEQGERFIDLATYLEYQINNDPTRADKVEFKALLEKSTTDFSITGNLVLEKELGVNATDGTEIGYALRAAGRWSPRVIPALEAFGSLGEVRNPKSLSLQGHLLGPVVNIYLSKRIVWQVGLLWGLTSGSDDLRAKSQLSWEWY